MQYTYDIITSGAQFLHLELEASFPRRFTSIMLKISVAQLVESLDQDGHHLLSNQASISFSLVAVVLKFLKVISSSTFGKQDLVHEEMKLWRILDKRLNGKLQ